MFSRINIAYLLMSRSIVVGMLTASTFGQIPAIGHSGGPTADLRFQVATVKPSRPEESRTVQIRGNLFVTTATSVFDLLKYAYGFHEQEIARGPEWLKTQKFDVVGDPETQTRPSSDDFKKMVRNLLTDRFHLAAHYETRDLAVFEIVPVKSGPKLTKSTRPSDGIPSVSYAPGRLSVANATLADFAAFLQRFATDRPVVDRTGITGKYDLTLRWLPDELQTKADHQGENDNGSLPGLFTAIQEQLGLKLKVERSPAQVFVVDHIDAPTEN